MNEKMAAMGVTRPGAGDRLGAQSMSSLSGTLGRWMRLAFGWAAGS